MLKNIFVDFQTESFPSSLEIYFDGHLHCRSELCSELGVEASRQDADLVLEAYKKWGKDFSRRLQGEYALVLVDPGCRTLLAVRDRLGIRPLYYARVAGSRILISSELTTVARSPLISRKPNDVAIGCYFLDDWSDQASTFYEGIFRLPPGHQFQLSTQDFRVEKYWQLEPQPILQLGSEQEYADCYSEIFQQAIRDRLPHHGKVGVLLSGGLDSSSVACLTEAVLQKELRPVELISYSLRFQDPAADDRQMLQILQNERHWKFRILEPDMDGLRFSQSETEGFSEDLFYDLGILLMSFIFRSAREDGVSQYFAGYGADDVLTPSEVYYADLLREGRWRDLYQELRINQYQGLDMLRALSQFALKPLVPSQWVRFLRRNLAPRRAPAWISSEFVKKHELLNQIAERYQIQTKFDTLSQTSRYFRFFVWGGYSRGWELLDQMARRHQSEFSQPLFDLRLIQYAFQLPQEQLTWRGGHKQLLRNAMLGVVPDPVRLQPKFQDYTHILESCLLRDRSFVEAWVFKSCLVERKIFSAQQLQELWASSLKNGQLAVALRIYNMERWLRTF